jgi:hypothetical protein
MMPNRVAGMIALPAPAPPDMEVRVLLFQMPAASALIAPALGQHRRGWPRLPAALAAAPAPSEDSTVNRYQLKVLLIGGRPAVSSSRRPVQRLGAKFLKESPPGLRAMLD